MKTGTEQDLLDALRPGQRVFIQGGPGECLAFYRLLKENPSVSNGIELWSCLIPGINTTDYASLPGDVRLVTFMASTALEASIASGRTRVDAMPYSEIGALLSRDAFDIAILHVAPPDRNKACSFGVSCDTASIVAPRARKRIAFVNTQMPSLRGAESIAASQIDLAVEIDEPLISPRTPSARSGAVEAIARHAAELVPDDAAIQSGIGETPAAVVAGLRLHRGLRVHSGIITPEYQQLAEAGALAADAEHLTGVAWGPAEFQRWLDQSGFVLRPIPQTHGHDVIAAIDGFVSIGSALEVDLAGNLNLEWAGGRRVSSVGGAPDFMWGAAASRRGLSIIALQAANGGSSRIVPSLSAPSVQASVADAVVTEHGVARLKGLSPARRAEALIAIAAPEHRAFLSRSARDLGH